MIVIPEKCEGCGKCCMWMQFKDLPEHTLCPDCELKWTVYFGRCPHLTKENLCDMYGGPLACGDEQYPIERGDVTCIGFLENYEKYK
jgi:hypothetical protein